MKIWRIFKGAGIKSSYRIMGAAGVVLVEDAKNILVDVVHFGIRDALLREMKKNSVAPTDIDIVVLIHLNWDHCLNIDLFPDARIITGKEELSLGTLSGVPEGLSDTFRNYLKTMKVNPVENDYKITPNVTVVSTPGHTPGHIAVKVLETGFLTVMSGDTIPNLRIYRRGMPDLAFFSEELARKSIEKIKNLDPDLIIPGHDARFTKIDYTENDKIDMIFIEEQEINTVITFGKTEVDRPVIFNA